MYRDSLLCIFIVFTAGLMHSGASAAQLLPERPTDIELQSLPIACQARLSGDAAIKKRWEQKIGTKNFLHLHHYCFGLNFTKRASTTFKKNDKQYYAKRAIVNFDYVLSNWSADSPLRPDAESGKREAELMLKLR